jgi:hypothetical protein
VERVPTGELRERPDWLTHDHRVRFIALWGELAEVSVGNDGEIYLSASLKRDTDLVANYTKKADELVEDAWLAAERIKIERRFRLR